MPLTWTVPAPLATGVAGADVGCGTRTRSQPAGTGAPRSTFTDYDIAATRAGAADRSLTDASLRTRDATAPAQRVTAAVFASDATYHQVDPAGVLAHVHDALEPGEVFGTFEPKAASAVRNDTDKVLAPWR